jgi:hypothetical protein
VSKASSRPHPLANRPTARGGSVVGAAAAFVRPDSRCFVAFRSCRAEAYGPLLEAIALYLQHDLCTEDDQADGVLHDEWVARARRSGSAGPSVGRGSVAGGLHRPLGSRPEGGAARMVTAEDVRRVAGSLPRSEERLIRDHVNFRVGRLVFVSISPDERSMGFAFPKEERAALVASERRSSTCRRPRMSVTTGCGCGWTRSTRQRCGSWSSRRGAWSCPSGSPPHTRIPEPTQGLAARRPAAHQLDEPARRARAEAGEQAVGGRVGDVDLGGHLVFAGRATSVPFMAVLTGPERTATDNITMAATCTDHCFPW